MSTESPANAATPSATPAQGGDDRLAAMAAHGAGILTWVIAPLALYLVHVGLDEVSNPRLRGQ